MSMWMITDDDCLQCCREIPGEAAKFELIQINSFPDPHHGEPFYQVAHATVDVLNDYTPEDMEDIVRFYGYDGMDDFIVQTSPIQDFVYKADGSLDRENSPGCTDCFIEYQLIAEMFFETESLEQGVEEFESWNSAVSRIEQLTGMVLYDYKDHGAELALVSDGRATHIITDKEFSNWPEDKLCVYIGAVPVKKAPERSADRLAEVLTDAINAGEKVSLSQQAASTLHLLLQPILDAKVSKANNFGVTGPALAWARDNAAFIDNLDTVLGALDLLTVKRIRPSVTQGTAAVQCCGKSVVAYRDEMWLKQSNGLMTNGHREKEGSHCGTVLGGWGSIQPDWYFRKASLTQYAERIASELKTVRVQTKEPGPALDDLIRKAQAKTDPATQEHHPMPDVSR